MRYSAALLGAALLLSTAGVARAQSDLESRLTITLTLQVQTELAGADSDTRITKIRFATKDLVAVMAQILDSPGVQSAVLQRENVFAAAAPTAFILNQTLALREADGTEVVPAATDFLATALPLDDLVGTTELLRTAVADRDQSAAGPILSRKQIGSEAVTWTFDAGGDVDTDDQIVLDLLSFNTVRSKRAFDGETDLGLWYTQRVATVHGAMSVDADSGFGPTARVGVVTGTIKTGPEKVQEIGP
jgi:hypothetical protein